MLFCVALVEDKEGLKLRVGVISEGVQYAWKAHEWDASVLTFSYKQNSMTHSNGMHSNTRYSTYVHMYVIRGNINLNEWDCSCRGDKWRHLSPCCVATAAAALWEVSPGTTGGETRARCLPFPSIVMLRDGVTQIWAQMMYSWKFCTFYITFRITFKQWLTTLRRCQEDETQLWCWTSQWNNPSCVS